MTLFRGGINSILVIKMHNFNDYKFFEIRRYRSTWQNMIGLKAVFRLKVYFQIVFEQV